MCTGSAPKAPKPAPLAEPMKEATATMSEASTDAARQQAMRRGLASVWTRFNKEPVGDGTANATTNAAPLATKLGGT